MGQLHDEIPPGRLLSLGPRPSAVARGRQRVRAGGVPSEALAAAILEASALLRHPPHRVLRPAHRVGIEWACGSVVASRCQSQAKRPT